MTRLIPPAIGIKPEHSKRRTLANVTDPLADQLSTLSLLLDQETAMLAKGHLTDFTAYIQKKSMILLQLDTHQAKCGPETLPQVLSELTVVRHKLVSNHAALELNIKALQELNELLAERHRDADSDGTYSMYRR
jgi:flagellar biosynthesis/type III secretory pathway chaperone